MVGRVDLPLLRLSPEEKKEDGRVETLPGLNKLLAKGAERKKDATGERVEVSTGPNGGLGVYESCALSPVRIVGRDA